MCCDFSVGCQIEVALKCRSAKLLLASCGDKVQGCSRTTSNTPDETSSRITHQPTITTRHSNQHTPPLTSHISFIMAWLQFSEETKVRHNAIACAYFHQGHHASSIWTIY